MPDYLTQKEIEIALDIATESTRRVGKHELIVIGTVAVNQYGKQRRTEDVDILAFSPRLLLSGPKFDIAFEQVCTERGYKSSTRKPRGGEADFYHIELPNKKIRFDVIKKIRVHPSIQTVLEELDVLRSVKIMNDVNIHIPTAEALFVLLMLRLDEKDIPNLHTLVHKANINKIRSFCVKHNIKDQMNRCMERIGFGRPEELHELVSQLPDSTLTKALKRAKQYVPKRHDDKVTAYIQYHLHTKNDKELEQFITYLKQRQKK